MPGTKYSAADIARWVKFKTQHGAPLQDTATLISALDALGGTPTPLKAGEVPVLDVTPEAPAPPPKVPVEKKK